MRNPDSVSLTATHPYEIVLSCMDKKQAQQNHDGVTKQKILRIRASYVSYVSDLSYVSYSSYVSYVSYVS